MEVDDIKDKYKELLDRGLAMMRRWHELWGKEATYSRLAESLKQTGRADLVELIKQDNLVVTQPPISASNSSTKDSNTVTVEI